MKLLAFFIVVLFVSNPALADCTLSGTAVCNGNSCAGETRPEGHVIYNTDFKAHQTCLNDEWIAVGGIGCPTGDGCPPPCDSGPIGTRCTSDGAIYAGTTVGGARMYAAACDHGMTWDGSTCTGSRTRLQWKTSNTSTAGTDSLTDGVANTDAMAAAGIALHPAAQACRNAGAEWYLPAPDESELLYADLVDQDGDSTPGGPLGTIFDFSTTGTADDVRYWVSAQPSQFFAYMKRFDNGSQGIANRSVNYYAVRCVRREP